MLKNKKLSIVLFLFVLVVLVGAGIWIGMTVIGGDRTPDPAAYSGYSAVSMASGDIYFGKLHWFPKPYLTDAFSLTKNTGQNGQTQIGLAAFKSAFWGPVGEIYFNPSQVLFTAPLRNDSQIVAAIKNPASLSAGNDVQAPVAEPASSTVPSPSSAK
jgi:hypothetical protein